MAQSLRNIFLIYFLNGSVLKKHIFNFFFKFYIRVQLINSVVLVSDVQQSNAVIHIYVLFYILFLYKLLQDIETVPCALE